MKKIFFVLCMVLLVVFLGVFFFSKKNTIDPDGDMALETFRGELVALNAHAGSFSLRKDGDQDLVEILASNDTVFQDSQGRSVAPGYFLPGVRLETRGIVTEGKMRARYITEMPRGSFAHYLNPDFKVVFTYPASWGPNIRHGSINGIPTHFEGREGFFTIDALQVDEGTLESAVGSIAYHKLKPYGDTPEIVHETIDGQEAAIIMPREGALKEAALVVRYPHEVRINNTVYSFFVVYTDKEHAEDIARSLRFFENNSAEKKLSSVPNILVYQPRMGDVVSGTFTVVGFARVFENQFSIRLSADGVGVLSEETASTHASDSGTYGYFEHEVTVSPMSLAKLKSHPQASLEVFEYSARDGSETSKVMVPITWQSDSIETTRVSVFFPNSKMDASGSCTNVYPVPRDIVRTKAVATAALEELLQGPNSGEREQGYFSNINAGVRIQRLAIQNGIATVDFDEALDRAVAGSCRVTSIRSQITQTLKQFPTVQSVVISVNGRTADILQP